MFLMDSVVLAEKLDVRRDVAWSRKLGRNSDSPALLTSDQFVSRMG